MNIRCFGAGLSAVLWFSAISSSAANDVLPSLYPDLSYHSLVDRFCIQGNSMRIYRISGPIDIERAKQKVASIVPVGSLADIQSDYLLAQWGNANESKLIGLWAVGPSRIEGIYSVILDGNSIANSVQKLNCFPNDALRKSATTWINSELGLLNLYSIIDYSVEKPTYMAMYSSWLGANALTDSVHTALKKNGWALTRNHNGASPTVLGRTIHASKEHAQLELNIFSVQGTSVIHMVAQQGE